MGTITLTIFITVNWMCILNGQQFAYWTVDGVEWDGNISGDTIIKALYVDIENVTVSFITHIDLVIEDKVTQKHFLFYTSIPKPTKENSLFKGWMVNGELINLGNYRFIEDTTLEAAYETGDTVMITIDPGFDRPFIYLHIEKHTYLSPYDLSEDYHIEMHHDEHAFKYYLIDGMIFDYKEVTQPFTLVATYEE